MQILVTVALFALGLLVIIKGGDLFVNAACWMAEVSGIPKFIIGATVVSVATTMPELLVSAIAALEGRVDMSVGNAVGTVTVNTGLVMGLSMLFAPGTIDRESFRAKALLMLTAAIVLLGFSFTGAIGWLPGGLLLILFTLFVLENIAAGKKGLKEGTEKRQFSARELPGRAAKFLLGALGIVAGARLMVDNGGALAEMLGVPEAVIAVTLMALGTSLPELITAISALRRGQAALSLGNIVGANVLDLTLILPICIPASGRALPIAQQTRVLDLPAMCIALTILVFPALLRDRLSRWQGALLLALYVGYLVFLFV